MQRLRIRIQIQSQRKDGTSERKIEREKHDKGTERERDGKRIIKENTQELIEVRQHNRQKEEDIENKNQKK